MWCISILKRENCWRTRHPNEYIPTLPSVHKWLGLHHKLFLCRCRVSVYCPVTRWPDYLSIRNSRKNEKRKGISIYVSRELISVLVGRSGKCSVRCVTNCHCFISVFCYLRIRCQRAWGLVRYPRWWISVRMYGWKTQWNQTMQWETMHRWETENTLNFSYPGVSINSFG